jgi:hypothetical protein
MSDNQPKPSPEYSDDSPTTAGVTMPDAVPSLMPSESATMAGGAISESIQPTIEIRNYGLAKQMQALVLLHWPAPRDPWRLLRVTADAVEAACARGAVVIAREPDATVSPYLPRVSANTRLSGPVG